MTLPSNPVVLIAYGEEDNLGVGYLMSVLNQAGISTRMIDFRYDNADILEGIRRYDPIVVGFSVIYESCINEFVRLARFLREGGTDCHFVAGGFYASLHPEELFGLIPELDSIVRFEGEYTFLELVECLRTKTDWRTIKGLAYRENGRVITTPTAATGEGPGPVPIPIQKTFD